MNEWVGWVYSAGVSEAVVVAVVGDGEVVLVGIFVEVEVLVGVFVNVNVGVCVGVLLGRGEEVSVIGIFIFVGIEEGVAVNSAVSSNVGDGVTDATRVGKGEFVAEMVAVVDGIGVMVGVG